jgi:hypothetical protein
MHVRYYHNAWYVANTSISSRQVPLVPRNLEFALDQEVGKERALVEPPAPSTATSGDTTAGDKPIRARGQHGRHKKYDNVHVIA